MGKALRQGHRKPELGMEKKDSFPFEQNAVWALLEMNDAEGS